MNKFRRAFFLLAVITVFLACSSFVSAQVVRVWVAGNGDDANPCSRIAPCKTFNGALAKLPLGGEINVFDSGFFGATTITKQVTIDATGVFAGVRGNAGTDGIVINAGASDVVVLRNLSINGFGQGRNGIKFNSGKALYLENCLIENFANYGVDFEPSGISTLVIRDSNILNSGSGPISNLPGARGNGGGVLIRTTSGTAFSTIDNTRIDGNFLGLAAGDNSKVTISNSVISRSATTGLLTLSYSAGPAEMNVERSVITLNAVGIQSGGCPEIRGLSGPATVRISGVSVTSNSSKGLSAGCLLPGIAAPAAIISSKNNTILGNNPDGAPTSSPPQQ
jgi:hypothetical protein